MAFPVPYEKTSRSVALAMAEVIQKKANGKRMTEYPYATAFLRNYFGTAKPTRVILNELCPSPYFTIPDINRELNRLIEGSGQCLTDLTHEFVIRAFPSLRTLDRLDAHHDLKSQQQDNVEAKHISAHDSLVHRYQCEVIELEASKLPEWVSDTTGELSEHEQEDILKNWFNAKSSDAEEYAFYDLYRGMSVSSISLDMSYS